MSPQRRRQRPANGLRPAFTEPLAELVDFGLWEGSHEAWRAARAQWWRDHKSERPAPLRGLWGMLADNYRAAGLEVPKGLAENEANSSERKREKAGPNVEANIRAAILGFRERHPGEPLTPALQEWANRLGL